jgi:hypothetical protein
MRKQPEDDDQRQSLETRRKKSRTDSMRARKGNMVPDAKLQGILSYQIS